jgi:hypothetical protein
MIEEKLSESWGAVRLRLLMSEGGHERLMGIGLMCAKLFNELKYEER